MKISCACALTPITDKSGSSLYAEKLSLSRAS